MSRDHIKFALTFPQGLILFMGREEAVLPGNVGNVYFQPRASTEAFIVYGERKELFGKHAITVSQDRNTGGGGYSVVYEFSDGKALSDARLVKGDQTVRGTLMDPAAVRDLNDVIASGGMTFYSDYDTRPDTIFNMARFEDGRLLIQLSNKNELYMGTPGNFEKVDAKPEVQGGNSMYYKLTSGGTVELPYGFGSPRHGENPKFDGEELTYITAFDRDPATYRLNLPSRPTHLDPFSPQLSTPAPVKARAPKAPGM